MYISSCFDNKTKHCFKFSFSFFSFSHFQIFKLLTFQNSKNRGATSTFQKFKISQLKQTKCLKFQISKTTNTVFHIPPSPPQPPLNRPTGRYVNNDNNNRNTPNAKYAPPRWPLVSIALRRLYILVCWVQCFGRARALLTVHPQTTNLLTSRLGKPGPWPLHINSRLKGAVDRELGGKFIRICSQFSIFDMVAEKLIF